MDKLSKHEFLDRAYIQLEQFNNAILDHVDYEKLPEETRALAGKIHTDLYALYNKMGGL